MLVLITGGAGFIGSHVAEALLARGHDVRLLDALLPGAHDGRPDGLPAGAELIEGDIRDLADYASHNDGGTAQLLRALALRGYAGAVVLASSMVVYGEGRYRCAEHGLVRPGPRTIADLDAGRFEPPCPVCGRPLAPEAVPEDAPADPRNVYAATKLHQEHLCEAWARETDGARVVSLRYHNVYGPRMPRDTPYAGVASIFRSSLEAGEAPKVFEDGGQLRDFIHVRDVAQANVLALEGDAHGAFNVATGHPRSVGEMAAALADAAGGPAPQVTGDYRRGDVRHVFASADRARAVLGLRAEITLEQGMAEFATAPLRRPAGG